MLCFSKYAMLMKFGSQYSLLLLLENKDDVVLNVVIIVSQQRHVLAIFKDLLPCWQI